MGEGSDLAGYLEHGRALDLVPVVFYIQCPTYCIELPYMGVSRETQQHTLRKAS